MSSDPLHGAPHGSDHRSDRGASHGSEPGSEQPLPPSLKGRYPFSLTVPSYLYPGTIELNVRLLRGLVDEMELLLFESLGESSLPTVMEIETIRVLSAESGLRFNVHLPLDIDIASADEETARRSLGTVARILDLTASLEPASYTLHVLRTETEPAAPWRERVRAALAALPEPRARFGVETLAWDLRDVRDILCGLGLTVCVDVGHLLLQGRSVAALLETFSDRISMIHLHGVRWGKDHQSLLHLEPGIRQTISDWVRRTHYRASLSVEVFGIDPYLESLPVVGSMFREETSPC